MFAMKAKHVNNLCLGNTDKFSKDSIKNEGE